MTMSEFVRKVRDIALAQNRRIFAVDFEPSGDGGIKLAFRFEPKP